MRLIITQIEDNLLTLNAIAVPPSSGNPPDHILVLLHGWGADANDLAPLAQVFDLPHYQCLFPNAPFPHPEVPSGLAWYALETPDYYGLAESRQQLRDWLLSLEDQTGVPLSRTVLGGFSQGGAMTLDVGLELPLAGLFSLSGYLHFQPHPLTTPIPPILMVHGKQDFVVPIEAARQTRDALNRINAKIEYHEFNMGHEIPQIVLNLVEKFIKQLN
ncbi:MAG: alpha/beta hydrolase [Snowella sp.]|nr:alpha/beta hydrolase [Snowella sp.]